MHYKTLICVANFLFNSNHFFDISTKKLFGAEALIRWNHPNKGLILPSKFIPIAEKSGLINELGEWIIHQVCKQINLWENSEFNKLIISVNLSPVQFKKGNLEFVLSNALEAYQINPKFIELEITESALIHDAESFGDTLVRLKKLGVHLSIDDFGTGYSNLTYLQKFKIDKLKIDQSFVRGIVKNSQDLAIVKAIIMMGKSMDLLTTAEGIEDDEVFNLLRELNCDIAQGYLFSKPVSIPEFEIIAAKNFSLF